MAVECDTDDQSVAHQLLVELLAHQFAFPVRWIDTQDVLLQDPKAISNFVELGPSSILTAMARRTQEIKYSTRDTVLGINRCFLAAARDQKKLRFHYDEPHKTPDLRPDSSLSAQVSDPVSVVQAVIAPDAKYPIVPDAEVSSLERVQTLVAYKLQKGRDAVTPSRSIKEITAGRSTLQNELIGDLLSEFGSTPEGAEDMPLSALASALDASGVKKSLGLELNQAVRKYVSSTMPTCLSLQAIRDYLSTVWGLPMMRQSSVLLHALTEFPGQSTTRYASEQDAKAALDCAVTTYADTCSLSLVKRIAVSGGASSSGQPSIDPALLEQASQKQRALARKEYDALGDFLGLSTQVYAAKLSQVTGTNQAQQDRLDAWNAELDTTFESGVQPLFDTKKIRRYNFWWNQARVDMMTLHHSVKQGLPASAGQIHRLVNRCNPELLNLGKRLFSETQDRCYRSDVRTALPSFVAKLESSSMQPSKAAFTFTCMKPGSHFGPDGSLEYRETPRFSDSRKTYKDYLVSDPPRTGSPVACSVRRETEWLTDEDSTSSLVDSIIQALDAGLTFEGRKVLVIGAGPSSIAAEIVRILLMGGATVIVTTSRSISEAQKDFRELYAESAGKNSELRLIPFNQGSVVDCKALIDYVYDSFGNIDTLLPFAALSENGREIDGIDSKSELAHRVMLLNVIRLIGFIAERKLAMVPAPPSTQVLLPLSPNHGIFGGDGLYSESKLGLENLLNRWHNESWNDAITLCGVNIGWTRGTGLTEANGVLSEMLEDNGVLTFSTQEMAINISALMTAPLVEICEQEPIIADLGGGLGKLTRCKALVTEYRNKIAAESSIRKAIYDQDVVERPAEQESLLASSESRPIPLPQRLFSPRIDFPVLPDWQETIAPLTSIQGMVDLSGVAVIVGFSELGPWGSSRTRWQMESEGRLSPAGYIEMAWMMGLIKHSSNPLQAGQHIGWVDAISGEAVQDHEVQYKYGGRILAQSGIRMVSSGQDSGADPKQREVLEEIVLEHDLPEMVIDPSTADALQSKHGDRFSMITREGNDHVRIKLLAGARILLPKSVPHLSSLVAGLLPNGWSALNYGIPDEIVKQVDPVTLYTLACVSEAFYSAGIRDPAEIFQHMHQSEMGIFLGSCMGGTEKTKEMYKDTFLDKQVQGDILQETYLNTPAAWVNMLLLGGAGPIKTPVGACATGIESIDIGLESIATGKTKMCLVGGYDNLQEDGSHAFSKMKATIDCAKDFAAGRTADEMSRPTAESRAGFVESQGAGVQILCNAELALEMGLPVYGIVAASSMAADGFGRSVPAPGQGALTFARETKDAINSPMLNIEYRRQQMEHAMLNMLSGRHSSSLETCSLAPSKPASEVSDAENLFEMVGDRSFSTSMRSIKRQWGNDIRQLDPSISPLRAGLAVWKLSVDDISVVSMHGTSTKANDLNEGKVVTQQMDHLHRKAPPLLAICQKNLTGHPKAPAASWMLNGCLQVMSRGLVPGNAKADNVDPALKAHDHIAYPTESIQTDGVKAFLLNSFGFGQKGGQMVGVAPQYLFTTLPQEVYAQYSTRCFARQRVAQQAFAKAMLERSLCKIKHPQPTPAHILLQPAGCDPSDVTHASDRDNSIVGQLLRADLTRLLSISTPGTSTDESDGETSDHLQDTQAHGAWVHQTLQRHPSSNVFGVGIDVEDINSFTSDRNPTFVRRNFTALEREHFAVAVDSHAALVGRWCAKEAVFKSLNAKSKGAGATMSEIEIVSDSGAPRVNLHGDASQCAADSGISEVLVSITYGEQNVTAIALSLRKGGKA